MFWTKEKNAVGQYTQSQDGYGDLSFKKQLHHIKSAIKNKQFTLFLQPVINLSDWHIRSAELLLRWNHPGFGILTPEHFMGSLEKSGHIHQIDSWVVKQAGKIHKHLLDSHQSPLCMSTNISCSQLMETSFIKFIDSVSHKNKITTNFLEIEITEQCMFDDIDQLSGILQQIRDKGIRVALKYSITGLPITINLNELPVDAINIDKNLTHQISRNRENRQIMSTILQFAHKHRLDINAEGVETAEQLLFLNAMQCNSAQGFLFSPPLTIKNFSRLYKSNARYDYLINKVYRRL